MSYFCIFNSSAQAIAADDLVEQCPSAVSESVCQSNPTTVQHHIEISAVISGRGNGKMSAKTVMLRLHGTGTKIINTGVLLLRTL